MATTPKKKSSIIANTTSKDREEVAAYANISVVTEDSAGREKLVRIGIYGLMLRDSHAVESAIIEMARENDLEGIESLDLRMSITLNDEDVQDDNVVFKKRK